MLLIFPIFNGHGPQTTKHSPEIVGAICGTCRGMCLIILQIIKKLFAVKFLYLVEASIFAHANV